jgi:uncharacterized repeat protein (TIGR01451 family)
MRTRDRTLVRERLAAGVALFCVAGLAPAATLDKAFLATSIASGASTTLRFTVTNAAGQPALTDVGFVDQLPSGLVIAAPAAVGGTCSNAAAATIATPGTATITVTSLDVLAGPTTCTVTVDVTNAAGQFNPSCAGNPASFTNASGNVTLTNVSDAIQPSCLVVTGGPVASAAVPAMREWALVLLAIVLAGAAFGTLRRSPEGR